MGPLAERREVPLQRVQHGVAADLQSAAYDFDMLGFVLAQVFVHHHGGQVADTPARQVFGVDLRERLPDAGR